MNMACVVMDNDLKFWKLFLDISHEEVVLGEGLSTNEFTHSYDQPCAEACAPGEGGTATAADFIQAAQPSCECTPADGKDPCDAIYGGKWTTQADGTACPAGGDDAGEGDAGEGDAGEGEGSGATQLLASAMVLAASLLI